MTLAYHAGELRIALDPSHPGHSLPPALPPDARVLDVGCGAGQTLIAAYHDRLTFGLDVDFGALELGHAFAAQHNARIVFAQGAAEALPYRSQSFDAVISRVAIPYTQVRHSLAEIARVLVPGGLIWLTLHDMRVPWAQVKRSNWKGKVHFAYVVANTALFHATERQVQFRGRNEVFFTDRGITNALRHAGFESIGIQHGRQYVVSAMRSTRAGEDSGR